MRLIIASCDALYDNSENAFFDGILEELNEFKALNDGNEVCIVSVHQENLDKIPDDFIKLFVGEKHRAGKNLVDKIVGSTDFSKYSDIFVLGALDEDLYLATNSKLILLTAEYAKENNPSSKIFNYGIKISEPAKLGVFLRHFSNLRNPWYYQLEVSSSTTLYVLTDAHSFVKWSASTDDKVVASINDKFRACLKSGITRHRDPFYLYFLMSTSLLSDLRTVNYWATYPSSTTEENDTLNWFKDKVRQLYGSRTVHPLFIRTENTKKRHYMNPEERISDGCDSQLDTIILNPWYKKRLKGAHICVIDDFTRFGSSCETARILLEAAGVEKITFIALGKFGNEYYKYDYKIEGSVFRDFTYKKIGYKSLTNGTYNDSSKNEYLESLRDLL